MMNFSISEKMTKIVANATIDIITDVVIQLSELYHFDSTEAMSRLNMEVTKKTKETKVPTQKIKNIPLPFTGFIDENYCQGIQKNYGLFTQCIKSKKEGSLFCKTCHEQALSNPSSKPNNGIIQEREQNLSEFKGVKPFIQVIKKLDITVEMVMEEASKKNIILPEDIFNNVPSSKKKGGRPKKTETKTSEPVIEQFEPIQQPVIEQPVIEQPVIEQPVIEQFEPIQQPVIEQPVPVIEQPVKKQPKGKGKVNVVEQKEEISEEQRKKEEIKKQVAKEKMLQKRIEKEQKEKEQKEKEQKEKERLEQLNKSNQDNESVVSELGDEEDEEEVEEVVIKGKNYLRDNKNNIYDYDTQEKIGIWNPQTKKLIV
jgi:hypothetical protein